MQKGKGRYKDRAERQLDLFMQHLVMIRETRGYFLEDEIKTLVYLARSVEMSSGKMAYDRRPKTIKVWKAVMTLL